MQVGGSILGIQDFVPVHRVMRHLVETRHPRPSWFQVRLCAFLMGCERPLHRAVLAWRRNPAHCTVPAASERTKGSGTGPWQEGSTLSLPSLGAFLFPAQAVAGCSALAIACPLNPHFSVAGLQRTAEHCSGHSCFSLTLQLEKAASAILGSNLANKPLPSPPRVVPLNPVITSAKLQLPRSAGW